MPSGVVASRRNCQIALIWRNFISYVLYSVYKYIYIYKNVYIYIYMYLPVIEWPKQQFQPGLATSKNNKVHKVQTLPTLQYLAAFKTFLTDDESNTHEEFPTWLAGRSRLGTSKLHDSSHKTVHFQGVVPLIQNRELPSHAWWHCRIKSDLIKKWVSEGFPTYPLVI